MATYAGRNSVAVMAFVAPIMAARPPSFISGPVHRNHHRTEVPCTAFRGCLALNCPTAAHTRVKNTPFGLREGHVLRAIDEDISEEEITKDCPPSSSVVERQPRVNNPWGFVEIERRVNQDVSSVGHTETDTHADDDTHAHAHTGLHQHTEEDGVASEKRTEDRAQQEALKGLEALKLCEWVPTHLYPALSRSPAPLSTSDLELLRRHVFGLRTFYVTKEDHTCAPLAVLFKGNLRGEYMEDAVEHVNQKLREAPEGLSDRVSLFLVEVPPDDPLDAAAWEKHQLDPRYGFIATSAAIEPNPPTPAAGAWSAASLLASMAASMAVAFFAYATNPHFIQEVLSPSATTDVWSVVSHITPVAAGLMAVQGVQEIAHRVAAGRWGLKLGLPFMLPSPHVGVFGAITPLQSFPRHKRALFDTSLSGPLSSLLVSIAVFVAGVYLTPTYMPVDIPDAAVLSGAADMSALGPTVHGSDVLSQLPAITMHQLHQSFLLTSLSHTILPHLPLLSEADKLPLHPLAFVGLCGALASAFNLLPVGRLDGGSAVGSAFGRNTSLRVATMALMLQAYVCITATDTGVPSLMLWSMLLATTLKRQETSPMEDMTPVDDDRRAILVATLFLTFLTLLPYHLPSLGT